MLIQIHLHERRLVLVQGIHIAGHERVLAASIRACLLILLVHLVEQLVPVVRDIAIFMITILLEMS